MNTPTPRTEARRIMATDNDTCKIKVLETVHASFARTLERELAALTAECDQLTARAERAEAELAAANERLRSEAMDDYASIKNLQRELAAERARVKKLSEASNAQLSLICGELTARELRTIRAVLGFILRNPEKNIEEVNEN